MFRISKADVACIAILFCVDFSVYAWWNINHADPAEDPESVVEIADSNTDTSPAFVASTTLASTNTAVEESEVSDPNYGLWEHTYGDYTVKTVRGPEDGDDSMLQIFKAGTLVYATNSQSFFDPEEKPPEADDNHPKGPRPYTNITGNGIPNLVIEEYSGGAHCCSTYHVFELGDEFREISTLDTYDAGAHFVDLDENGIFGIRTADPSYAYAFTSYAGSFLPAAALRFVDGKYSLATDWMFTPPLPEEEFAAIVTEVNTTYTTPSEDGSAITPPSQWGGDAILWNKMLDLTYTGHVDQALALLDRCWQDDWGDQQSAADKFWKTVALSTYGRAVVEAQGYELPEVTPEDAAKDD